MKAPAAASAGLSLAELLVGVAVLGLLISLGWRGGDVTPFIGPVLMRVGGRDHAAAPC